MKIQKWIGLLLVAALAVSLFAGCAKPAQVPINSPEDLNEKRIGVQEGTTGDTYVTDNVTDAAISRFKKPTDAALDLKNAKLDAVVLDEMPAKKIVEKNPDLKILEFNLTNEDYAIAIAKGNDEKLAQINKTMQRIKEDGTYDKLIDKYMNNEDVELPEIPDYTSNGTLIMGTNAEFEPFEFRDDANNIVGFDVEIAKQIAYDMGLELKIEDMAFDSLTMALASGKVDIVIAGMTADDERRKEVDFSEPYYNASQVIIVRK